MLSLTGLTDAEVAERVARGAVNVSTSRNSRSVGDIIRRNVVTPFNILLGSLAAVTIVVSSPRDALFGFILVINTLIGIVQELRAKFTLDRLAIVSAPTATVIRADQRRTVDLGQIVIDDLVVLASGDQIPVDAVVVSSAALTVDESLLTGESDQVAKAADSNVMSGSIVTAGSGVVRATAVGDQSYASRLANETKAFTLTRSELMEGIGRLVKWISWAIAVVGPLLVFSGLVRSNEPWRDALTSAVAGVVGMVPEGLILLISLAFVVATTSLSRRNVLVQELPAVEGLARVDVVCLDKTGTITEGVIELNEVEVIDGTTTTDDARAALASLAASSGDAANATSEAVLRAITAPGWEVLETVPFSSARKWSAASFTGHGTLVMGAPELVWSDATSEVRTRADTLAAQGTRTLLLAESKQELHGEVLPDDLVAVALITFEERVRPDAAETLAYFASQGVALKVISGDNPKTVGAVAARVGLDPGPDGAIDARTLPAIDDVAAFAAAVDAHTVFGRVTPEQKRAFVKALQSKGHVVAMTGDGVNDALALKDADIGVAMGNGAPATRAVAQLVLLDGKFSSMPGVVAEGRRVMANVERVANLFVVKNVYATVMSLVVAIAGRSFPFLPRHLTVLSSLTIGIPAFFLALGPNPRRYVPGFIRRVLRFSVPAGVITAAAGLGAFFLVSAEATLKEARSATTLVVGIVALFVLSWLARPLLGWKVGLVLTMAVVFASGVAIEGVRKFFAFDLPHLSLIVMSVAMAAGAIALLAFTLWSDRPRQPEAIHTV